MKINLYKFFMIYYLFVEDTQIIGDLQRINLPGIIFKKIIKVNYLPKCILLETTIFEDVGVYNELQKHIKNFTIVKPLSLKRMI
jgi:hypothetical protein